MVEKLADVLQAGKWETASWDASDPHQESARAPGEPSGKPSTRGLPDGLGYGLGVLLKLAT